jgi:S1-C subfamily serine protease
MGCWSIVLVLFALTNDRKNNRDGSHHAGSPLGGIGIGGSSRSDGVDGGGIRGDGDGDGGGGWTAMSRNAHGVCRIEVARVEWDSLQPWQRCPQYRSTGTGFVIEGERLLTNAHVVKSAIDIRVRPHGSTRRFPAVVVCYAPDVDLALLRILGETEHADFFGHHQRGTEEQAGEWEDRQRQTSSDAAEGSTGTTPARRPRTSMALEFATELPALQEAVHVVGFPTGGRTICVTEGVVSRIDLMDRIVCIQVDSAINPGSSGGPAFNSRGQVTG